MSIYSTVDRITLLDILRLFFSFQAKLKTLSGDHEIYIYENAGHAFANEGSRYVKEAAELAWSRTVTFLKKTL